MFSAYQKESSRAVRHASDDASLVERQEDTQRSSRAKTAKQIARHLNIVTAEEMLKQREGAWHEPVAPCKPSH